MDTQNTDIIEAFTQIAREKNIDKDELNLIIEDIFRTMIKKKFGTTDNFDIIVNLDKAAIEIFQKKTVVEEVEDPVTQIDLETAQRQEPDLQFGDEYVEIINPASFGRRLVIGARLTLSQKLREIERKALYDEFINRKGEIIVGEVRQIHRKELFVSFERAELIMPKEEQIANERYKRGQTIKALIKDVIDDAKGLRIIVSRADPQFLIRLFENEVPEIYDGIIEIKAIAREPGERTKLAVYSNDKRIDAVGACVGMKGIRIQSIVKELNNEKIDIISWSSDPEILISRALSPAKPLRIEINSTKRTALAVINDDEMSIAVGRHGQNIILASELTGYEIQTIKYSDMGKAIEEGIMPSYYGAGMDYIPDAQTADHAEDESDDDEITPDTLIAEIKGISESASEILAEAGYERLGDITDVEEIKNIEGISARSMNKLIATLNKISYQE